MIFDIVFPEIVIGDGFLEAANKLAYDILKMGNALGEMRTPLEISVEEVLIPSIEANFALQGRPPWPPLAPATLKQRGPENQRILYRTGNLFRAATSRDIWIITDDSAIVNSAELDARAFYAGYHQAGTRKMPARPFLMIQAEDADLIQETFGKWLDMQVDHYFGFES